MKTKKTQMVVVAKSSCNNSEDASFFFRSLVFVTKSNKEVVDFMRCELGDDNTQVTQEMLLISFVYSLYKFYG